MEVSWFLVERTTLIGGGAATNNWKGDWRLKIDGEVALHRWITPSFLSRPGSSTELSRAHVAAPTKPTPARKFAISSLWFPLALSFPPSSLSEMPSLLFRLPLPARCGGYIQLG
jgi:hypothetical protein